MSVISSVRLAVGDLDRVAAWVTVTGFVQAEPGYGRTTAVVNAFSEAVIKILATLPGNTPASPLAQQRCRSTCRSL